MKAYTTQEVAEKLGLNRNVVIGKVKKGEIKGKKCGEWLVSEESLLEYTHGIEEVMLVKDFAKLVRKCTKTIRDKAIEGSIRGVKLGKLWYIDKRELNKFI